MGADCVYAMRHFFDMPDLANIDDVISDGAYHAQASRVQPLALFPATRIDYALHRLKHYTGTDPEHFQSFVLFTNYQFYVDEFVRLAPAMLARVADDEMDDETDDAGYCAFVEPGNVVTRIGTGGKVEACGRYLDRMPQMPAYHLQRLDGRGITLINIGVGPSNAKNITDHVAVLRPHCWMMLGHCAGLRNTQRLGDYVLAHAYLRKDGIMDKILDVSVPIPAIAEVQTALYKAIAAVSGLNDYDLKRVLRTGTVATVADRNWELLDYQWLLEDFSQSRAIALDMESATIAANGFRYRVPYGTLLCVSDKPLHGEIKLPGMADDFYRERVNQHLQIGIRAMELLRAEANRLHSRKLRTFAEPAFR
jgi:AMP nucleosidase